MGFSLRQIIRSLPAIIFLSCCLPVASARFGHQINFTQCCEQVIDESNDGEAFGFNYKEWNNQVWLFGDNQTIPAPRPDTQENKLWNSKVEEWKENPNRSEFLDFRCGENYNNDGPIPSPTAPSITATLQWCAKTPQCNGYEVSHLGELNQWAGPLVGFLLPGLVFSMSIPRSWEITLPEALFESNLKAHNLRQRILLYLFKGILITIRLLVALSITTFETILWVIVILILAGPMLVGGIYEMLLDHRLLARLRDLTDQEFQGTAAIELKKRKILITLLLGNLSGGSGDDPENSSNPVIDSENFIANSSAAEAKARLHSLLESQAAFGSAVGAPVTFYIGAYAYALLDAKSHLGDNDTSHALALGLWYSIFVLVAIICGCLLGCNNPATIEGIVTDKPPRPDQKTRSAFMFISRYKPVSIWNRGLSASQWAQDHKCLEKVKTRDWILYMGVFSVFLISVPCWLACVVAYSTPDIGLGCRSFMIFLYWLSQMVLIVFVIFIETVDNRLVLAGGFILSIFALLVSLFTAIGGTIMQIAGVYRNCWCKAGIRSFINQNGNYFLEFATDTALDRRMAATLWMRTGLAGLVFVAAICLCAWWYQRDMRRHCSRLIHGLESLPAPESHLFMLRASMEDPQLPYRQYVTASVDDSTIENLYLGPESLGAHLQLEHGHLIMRFSPYDRVCRTRYIHVQQQDDGARNPSKNFEMTWSDDPDSRPAGIFEWQGNRLVWVTSIGREIRNLDGFLTKGTGPRQKIFINSNAYGVNPLIPDSLPPDHLAASIRSSDPLIMKRSTSDQSEWIHFTLHRIQQLRGQRDSSTT